MTKFSVDWRKVGLMSGCGVAVVTFGALAIWFLSPLPPTPGVSTAIPKPYISWSPPQPTTPSIQEVLDSDQPRPVSPGSTMVVDDGVSTTIKSLTYGFSVQYSDADQLVTDGNELDQEYRWFLLGGVPLFAAQIAPSIEQVVIELSTSTYSVANCLTSNPPESDDEETIGGVGTTTISGVPFFTFVVGSVGAGQTMSMIWNKTIWDGSCYAIVQSQFAWSQRTEADQQMLSQLAAKASAIVQSFRFADPVVGR